MEKMKNRKNIYIVILLLFMLLLFNILRFINLNATNLELNNSYDETKEKLDNQQSAFDSLTADYKELQEKYEPYEVLDSKNSELDSAKEKLDETNSSLEKALEAQQKAEKAQATAENELDEVNEKLAQKESEAALTQDVGLALCNDSFTGVGTCSIQEDMLVITPDDSSLLFAAKLDTDAWRELVASAKVAAKAMADYGYIGLAIANPSNPDMVILSVSSLGIVVYDLGRDG